MSVIVKDDGMLSTYLIKNDCCVLSAERNELFELFAT